jgi:hypothetical protein
LLDDHQAGIFDHGHRLWALLVLELWHREWVDGSPSAVVGRGATAAAAGATTRE